MLYHQQYRIIYFPYMPPNRYTADFHRIAPNSMRKCVRGEGTHYIGCLCSPTPRNKYYYHHAQLFRRFFLLNGRFHFKNKKECINMATMMG